MSEPERPIRGASPEASLAALDAELQRLLAGLGVRAARGDPELLDMLSAQLGGAVDAIGFARRFVSVERAAAAATLFRLRSDPRVGPLRSDVLLPLVIFARDPAAAVEPWPASHRRELAAVLAAYGLPLDEAPGA